MHAELLVVCAPACVTESRITPPGAAHHEALDVAEVRAMDGLTGGDCFLTVYGTSFHMASISTVMLSAVFMRSTPHSHLKSM